ncbi:response regulator (plasmid) [Lichenicola cladoniae]|uniref:Response regulator n=1 Tax=Lichenicola cladoniae TaxID=1484109 RepID=A0A6M8HYF3_9PROT|nr:response regulator [Lichenicola cladoniae]NPD68186.1 response regulator [Acetobacteraceae bacterium]QKE93563.1 response regulator [Lichenicola cladoniae]
MNIGHGAQRRTILLIDHDPHARAVLRNALEAAGFSVGEAASHREGERTALRIAPDAILADLMLDTDVSSDGRMVSEKLRAAGSLIPCYVVSTAAEALIGAVGLHELGISGVFLKPVDAFVVIQTLRTRLGMTGRVGVQVSAHA